MGNWSIAEHLSVGQIRKNAVKYRDPEMPIFSRYNILCPLCDFCIRLVIYLWASSYLNLRNLKVACSLNGIFILILERRRNQDDEHEHSPNPDKTEFLSSCFSEWNFTTSYLILCISRSVFIHFIYETLVFNVLSDRTHILIFSMHYLLRWTGLRVHLLFC